MDYDCQTGDQGGHHLLVWMKGAELVVNVGLWPVLVFDRPGRKNYWQESDEGFVN